MTMNVRCGSTLLAQALHLVPSCRSYSEPAVYNDIIRRWQYGRIGEAQAKHLVQRYIPT